MHAAKMTATRVARKATIELATGGRGGGVGSVAADGSWNARTGEVELEAAGAVGCGAGQLSLGTAAAAAAAAAAVGAREADREATTRW
jgi:hypothetical protein